jgi:hypothetical protein
MIYIGIDPGLEGGIVVLTHDEQQYNLEAVVKMPLIKPIRGKIKVNAIDYEKLYTIIANKHYFNKSACFCLEWYNVPRHSGILRQQLKALEDILNDMGARYEKVNPKRWQRDLSITCGVWEPNTKKLSRLVAQKLGIKCGINIEPLLGSRGVLDHNLCDALCLAYYGHLMGFARAAPTNNPRPDAHMRAFSKPESPKMPKPKTGYFAEDSKPPNPDHYMRTMIMHEMTEHFIYTKEWKRYIERLRTIDINEFGFVFTDELIEGINRQLIRLCESCNRIILPMPDHSYPSAEFEGLCLEWGLIQLYVNADKIEFYHVNKLKKD